MGERRVSLLRDDGRQTVRIPPDLELPGREAVIRREEGRLIIEPVSARSLLAVLATLDPIEEEWPEIDDRPPEPVGL